MIEDLSDRRLASRIIEHIGEIGITVAVYRIGPEAEGGWELRAFDHHTGQSFRVESDRSLTAATELAIVANVEIDE